MVQRPLTRAAALAVAGLVAACATPGPDRPPAEPPAAGYLSAEAARTVAGRAVPPPGEPDSRDLALLQAVEPGSDRWWLASAHAELRPPWAAQHFDCVLGTRLGQRPRPALERLMQRLLADVGVVARDVLPGRPRPASAINGLRPCERLGPALRDSPSWPAGGAAAAAVWGETFAALAPDLAGEARRTAREIAYSRVVCRMNWASDAEAGLRLGEAIFAAAAIAPGFREDLAAARVEVDAARAEGLSSAACAAERRALRQWSTPPPQS